jgi:hypothetical protein
MTDPIRKIDRDKLLEFAAKGMTRAQMAEHFKCSRQAITFAYARTPELHRQKSTPKVDQAELIRLLASGMTQAGTARHFGCAESTIHGHISRLRRDGKLPPNPTAPPPRNVMAFSIASEAPYSAKSRLTATHVAKTQSDAVARNFAGFCSPFLSRLCDVARKELYDTGGRYADLNAWAARHGIKNPVQWWLQLTMPVSKGKQG